MPGATAYPQIFQGRHRIRILDNDVEELLDPVRLRQVQLHEYSGVELLNDRPEIAKRFVDVILETSMISQQFFFRLIRIYRTPFAVSNAHSATA